MLAAAEVAGVFPELPPPADVTIVTEEGEAEPGKLELEGLVEDIGETTGPVVRGPPSPEPPMVKTVVDLDDSFPSDPIIVVLGMYEGMVVFDVPEVSVEDIGWVIGGGSAMMVMREGTGPPLIVVMIVMRGRVDESDSADNGGSAVAMTVMTEGVGPAMVVTIVIGGRDSEGGVPDAES